MLMGHSTAVVCTINMPTGSRRQRYLEKKYSFIYLMLFCLPLFVLLFSDGGQEEMD
jgi:hypothetical protein